MENDKKIEEALDYEITLLKCYTKAKKENNVALEEYYEKKLKHLRIHIDFLYNQK
jgi:hypothetical protein